MKKELAGIEQKSENQSVSSVQNLNVKRASLLLKIQKVSQHVQKMLTAKTSIDVVLAVIVAAKAAFDNAKSITLFVLDFNLQYLVANRGQNKNHYKEIPCEGIQGN